MRSRSGPLGRLGDSDVREALSALYREGAARWPTLRLDPASFGTFVADRAEPANIEELLSLRGEDLYLLGAYILGDIQARDAFETQCVRRVDAALRKIGTPPHIADEVKQEVRLRVVLGRSVDPTRKPYAGTGELSAWMCVTAVRRAIELRRRGTRELGVDDQVICNMPMVGDDIELVYLKTRYRFEFKEAFSEALLSLSKRERNVLRYYLVRGLNLDEVGAIYDVHRATIARWLARARTKLLDRTRLGLSRRLRIAPEEFGSILRLIGSHLNGSMHRILETS